MTKGRSPLPARILDGVLFVCRKFSRSNPPTWSMMVLLVCTYSGVIPARTPGFYCNDSSINHIYTGDTVGTMELLALSFCLPLLFFIIVELLHLKYQSRILDIDVLKQGILRAVKIWWAYFIGQLFVMTAVEVSKTVISEPRPHFMDTCRPNVTEQSCKDEPYVTNYICNHGTSVSRRTITDSQKSFPSGHAAVSLFAAIYMIWYLNHRISWSRSHLLKPVLQLLWVLFAIVCSVTRVLDRRHHWWDVLAGGVLGLFVAFLVINQRTHSKITQYNTSDYIKEIPESAVNGETALNPVGESGQSRPSNEKRKDKRPSVKRLLSTSSFSQDPEGAATS